VPDGLRSDARLVGHEENGAAPHVSGPVVLSASASSVPLRRAPRNRYGEAP
jgi:hypothetical protein